MVKGRSKNVLETVGRSFEAFKKAMKMLEMLYNIILETYRIGHTVMPTVY